MNTRIVFMGSPEFAVPTLASLAGSFNVVGVVTQPDRPAGRGRKITAPPVKILAEKLDLPTIQPARLRLPEAMDQLRIWNPDLIVVAAFGQILRNEVLKLPKYGCLNVHASLLPRWRGAAPIPAAILHGDRETGVSLMVMDAGIDTGPVIRQKAVSVHPEETAGELSIRLAKTGADLLIEILPGYIEGRYTALAQDETLVTYAPLLHKKDGELDFNRSSTELVRKVRAFNPWPGAYTTWKGEMIKIHRAASRAGSQGDFDFFPGMRIIVDGLPAITTADGTLALEEIQVAGKKPVSGKAFLQGARNWGQTTCDG